MQQSMGQCITVSTQISASARSRCYGRNTSTPKEPNRYRLQARTVAFTATCEGSSSAATYRHRARSWSSTPSPRDDRREVAARTTVYRDPTPAPSPLSRRQPPSRRCCSTRRRAAPQGQAERPAPKTRTRSSRRRGESRITPIAYGIGYCGNVHLTGLRGVQVMQAVGGYPPDDEL